MEYGDLISRQAAIVALDEYADRLQMVDWKENPGVPYKAYALNWCINTIRDLPSAQPEPRWIPVSEKPKKNGEYLVTKIDRITHDRLVDIAHYANFIHDNNGFYKGDAVIAWMPTPKPYRKETEDAEIH